MFTRGYLWNVAQSTGCDLRKESGYTGYLAIFQLLNVCVFVCVALDPFLHVEINISHMSEYLIVTPKK